MSLLPALLVGLGLISSPAHAKGKKKGDDVGLRLKMSSDLLMVDALEVEVDGQEVDSQSTRITTLSVFESAPRLETTYFLGKGLEVGGMLSYSQSRGTQGDGEIPLSRHTFIAATGAYNVGLGNGLRFYGQPILGLDRAGTNLGEDQGETKVATTVFGADAGLRIKVLKKATVDAAGELLLGRGTVTVDGTTDNDTRYKSTRYGLRIGLSMRL